MEIDTKCRRKMGGTENQKQEPTSTVPVENPYQNPIMKNPII